MFETLEFRTLHQRALRILSFTDTSDHAEPSDADEVSALNALSDLEIVSLGHDLAAGRLAEWLEAGSPAAEGDCPRPWVSMSSVSSSPWRAMPRSCHCPTALGRSPST